MSWHWHKFEAVAVQHFTKQSPMDVATGNSEDVKQGIGIQQTHILSRCTCGKVKVEAVRGWWTLEQIQGKSSKA